MQRACSLQIVPVQGLLESQKKQEWKEVSGSLVERNACDTAVFLGDLEDDFFGDFEAFLGDLDLAAPVAFFAAGLPLLAGDFALSRSPRLCRTTRVSL